MHTIGVTQQGNLWAMGNNVSGQLGLGARENMRVPTNVGGATDVVFGNLPLVSASCRESFTLALTSEGTVYSFGQGINILLETLGYILDDSLLPMRIEQHRFHDHKVVSVFSGFNHATAVTRNDGLYTRGLVDSTCGDAVLAQANLNVGNGDLLVLVDRYLPVLMEPNALRHDADLIQTDTRVGRFHNLLTEHALAFAMGTHPRLGRVISTNRALRRFQGKWPDNFFTNTPCVRRDSS